MSGFDHGRICWRFIRYLGNHVAENDLGELLTNDTRVRTASGPDTVLGMDVAFVSYARVPKGHRQAGRLEVAPELVAEVRSPSEAWTEVMAKALEYLSAGVVVVLIIDPGSQSVSEYREDVYQRFYNVGQTLTMEDILPGFALPVARLFE